MIEEKREHLRKTPLERAEPKVEDKKKTQILGMRLAASKRKI